MDEESWETLFPGEGNVIMTFVKRISILIILMMFSQVAPSAFGAKKLCTKQELISVNQLAIDFNKNRSYFLRMLLYVDSSNDGIVKSRNDRDSNGEEGYLKNYNLSSSYAQSFADKGIKIEKNIRNLLAQCTSGYGVNFSSDYGYLRMSKTIKGIKFPSFKIPNLVVMPTVSSSSTNPAPKPSTTPTELVYIPGVNDKEFFVAQGDRLAALNLAASEKYKCVPYVDCQLGSIGPGGGVVFFDAGTTYGWGRYLEIAPFRWDRSVIPTGALYDPVFAWCEPKNETIKANAESIFDPTKSEIGNGMSNSQILVVNCLSGAGNAARNYVGGGKTDWYLPTSGEMHRIDDLAQEEKRGGYDRVKMFLDNGRYWSSNCAHVGYGCGTVFARGFRYNENWPMNPLRKWEKETALIRPVRAF